MTHNLHVCVVNQCIEVFNFGVGNFDARYFWVVKFLLVYSYYYHKIILLALEINICSMVLYNLVVLFTEITKPC